MYVRLRLSVRKGRLRNTKRLLETAGAFMGCPLAAGYKPISLSHAQSSEPVVRDE